MKININYVLKCLKYEEYEYAIEYLDDVKKEDETRLGNQLLRIIVTMNRINNFNKYDYPIVDYKNPKEKSIARFFESLKYKDFKEASELVDNCIEYLKKNYRDYEEMNIYKQVLVYANEVQQRTLRRSNNLTRMSNLTHEIEVYTKNNNEVKFDDLFWLLDYMEQIMEISDEVERFSSKIQYASELINTIINLSDGVYRDKNYFGDVSNYSEDHNLLSKFYTQMTNGQYTSAFSTMKRYMHHSNRNRDWIYKLYYMLLNCLNRMLTAYKPEDKNYIVHNQNIDYNDLFDKTLRDENINDPELLGNLALVRSLTKQGR